MSLNLNFFKNYFYGFSPWKIWKQGQIGPSVLGMSYPIWIRVTKYFSQCFCNLLSEKWYLVQISQDWCGNAKVLEASVVRLKIQWCDPLDLSYKAISRIWSLWHRIQSKNKNSFSFGLSWLIVGFGIVRPSENVDAASDKLIPYYIYFKWNV